MVRKKRGRKQRSKEKVFPSTAKKSVFAVSKDDEEEIRTLKAYPKAGDKFGKNLPNSKSHASPAFEQFKGIKSLMDGLGNVSTEVSLKRMRITDDHNHRSCNISCSLFSENVNCEVPKINAAQTTTVQKACDLGCEGDDISCISNHHADTDQKNLSGSSTSVSSFCQEGSEKPVDVQSTNNGCFGDECIAEVARETIQSAADLSDKSDPSETSSLRDEHGPVSPKAESASPVRGTDLLQKGSNGFTDNCKSNGEICSNGANTDVLNKLDQKQHSETKMTHDMQKTHRAVGDNEETEELIDVRVCDICGDVGREPLLAVCSKCSDGAEHIYCMRIKMDKVPGGEWMCEDCTDSQMQKAEEHKIGRALQKSSTNEGAQNSRKVDSSFSRKRPWLNVDVNTSSKKRVLENMVQLSSPRSLLKSVSPRHSNLKIPLKDELASPSGRSCLQNVSRKGYELLPGRSPRIESQLHKGPFFKQKNSNSPRVRTDRESEDVQRGHKTIAGSSAFGAGQHHALTKLKKSKSFTTSSIVRLDRNDSKKIMENDFKIPKGGLKRSLTQRSYSFNSKTSPSASSNVNSSISIVKPAKVAPSPVEVKQRAVQNGHSVAKTSDVRKELERAAIHRVAKRRCDTNGSGLKRKISSSLANSSRSPGTSGRTGTVSLGQKADRSSVNVEKERKPKDVKPELNCTDKVQINGSPSRATVTLPVSAHPDFDCVWRGMFNLECNKLPICCSGLQAHLSTCASPKALEVASNLPSEITVKEVLQHDIWPVQFNQNCVTENDIALYFFAEDNESYRRYKRFLNCMMLNDLALIAHLEGAELLIFHSQVLPAKSRRWNNLFFLWGVFRAKQSSYNDDVRAPRPHKSIQIPTPNIITPPGNPFIPNPIISSPKNSIVSTEADPVISIAEAGPVISVAEADPVVSVAEADPVASVAEADPVVSVAEADPVVSVAEADPVVSVAEADPVVSVAEADPVVSVAEAFSKSVIESPISTKSDDNEVDIKTMETTVAEKERHSEEPQFMNDDQKENTSPDQAPEVKPIEEEVTPVQHQAEKFDIDVNAPLETNGFEEYEEMNRRTISLNSSPSNSGGTGASEIHHHHDFNLELPLLAEEIEPEIAPVNNNPNVEDNGFVSLDLSLALPSIDTNPVPMMEDPIPEMDDDGVDTSLSLFFGAKRAF